MRVGKRWLAFSLVCNALVAACDSEPSGPQAGAILSVAVDSSVGPLVRTLSVDLDGPADVEVDYYAAAVPRLRVMSAEPASEHSLLISRLVSSTTYEFEVRTVDSGGRRGTPFRGRFSTDSLPEALGKIRFETTGVSSLPLTMLEVRAQPFYAFVIIDSAGRVVWYWSTLFPPQGFTRRANRNFVFLDTGRGLFEVSPARQVIAALPQEFSPLPRLHHDVVATPQNTVLFLAADVERIVNDTVWVGDAIWEWDPERAVQELRFDPFDFMSPATDRGPRSRPDDWLHANSLSIGPRGNIVVSWRSLNQVASIASDFESIEWRLNGVGSTIDVAGGAGFWGQHTGAEVSPGHVLVFDNGLDRPEGAKYSRALELGLDTQANTAAQVWEFRPEPDNYAPFISSARRLANGNTLINFGVGEGLLGSVGPIEVYEVTPTGQVVWHLVVTGPSTMYRATPISDIAGEVTVP